MKSILAFAGSNSKNSINKQLVIYAANQTKNTEVTVLDLNDFELPIYGIDYEIEHGIPDNAQTFLNHIKSADGIILSLAEHNGAYASVFKNIYDWMSRIDGKLWNEKPMLLMATSPGGRGGATVLEIAKGRFPYMGGNVVSDFSLPSFNDNFSNGKISNEAFNEALLKQVSIFRKSHIMGDISKDINSKFPNSKVKALLNIIYTANWISSKQTTFFKPYGISSQQFNVLRILRGAGEAIKVQTIKERMLERAPNATRLMDKLCDKDLIERLPCPEDRRVVHINITKKGLGLLDEISKHMKSDYLKNLTEDEASQLSDLLDKLR